MEAKKVDPGKNPIIGRIGVGLAACADAPARDISTFDALKQVLLRTDSIVLNNVASGNSFLKVLDQIKIGDAVTGAATTRTGTHPFAGELPIHIRCTITS